MPYSLCLSALYPDLFLPERLAEAQRQGFTAVECWQLGDMMAQGLPGLLRENGLHLTAFCPDVFVLNDPSARSAYLDALRRTLENARLLDCHALITQVGQDNGQPREVQHASIVEGLRAAAPLLEEAGATLLVEPLNTVKDHPGYYLTSSREAFDIIREVGSPCVKVCYDVYHQLHMGEDVLSVIRENLEDVGHFHIAGFPARDERLFDGVYDYRPLLRSLREMNIGQAVGVELFPSSPEARENVLQQLKDL